MVNHRALYSAGSNAKGQLSNGTCEDSHSFQSCQFDGDNIDIQDILSVTGGANHSLVLLRTACNSGSSVGIWGCGDGSKGQLGPRLQNQQPHSVLCSLDLDFPQNTTPRLIAAAWETSYIVCTSSSGNDVLFSMGSNDYGDLGIGETIPSSLNIVRFDHLLDGFPSYTQLRIAKLVAGTHHVVAELLVTLQSGSIIDLLVGWGSARLGQIGNVIGPNGKPSQFVASPRLISNLSEDDRAVSISAGNQHSAILLRSGKILGLGSDRKHQLSGLSSISHGDYVACTWNGTYLVQDGRCFSTGSFAKGQLGRVVPAEQPITLDVVPLVGELKDLACGSEHVLVHLVTSEGDEVWGWGWNEHGNLGTGDTTDVISPVKMRSFCGSEGRVVGIWGGCGTSWIAVAT